MKKIIMKSFQFVLLLVLVFVAIPLNCSATTIANNKPKVVIDSFTVTDDAIIPGEEFELTLSLKNQSSSFSVNSILVTCSNEEDLITPVYGSSNQAVIDTIGAGETKEVTLTLKAASNIEETSIRYDIAVEFSDDQQSSNVNESSIQLPVTESSKFVVDSVSLPERVYLNDNTRLNVSYQNVGVIDFYNVVMYVNGEGFNTPQEINVGSLTAGNVGYTEAYVDFTEENEQEATVSFTYEDIEGNQYETDPYKFTLTAVEGEDSESQSTTIVEDSTDYKGIITKGVLVLATLLALAGLAVLIRKDRK